MSLDPRIEAVRAQYGLSKDDFWQIPQNKQWVCKHAALEVVATKANVEWMPPQIIQADTGNGIAVLAVHGRLGEREEWATGEASPKNNKNSYPWAMAEKRGKDRVVLKLVGIHGLVYSEEEADDFKSSQMPANQSEPAAKSSAQLKRDGEWERVTSQLHQELLDVKTERALDEVMEAYRQHARANGWTKAWLFQLSDIFETKRAELKSELMMAG